jgi:tRNA-specific 2-thiouridylase
MSTVVLAMSGGVDSSVAAQLLLEAGHDVVGVFMRHGAPAETSVCGSRDEHGLPVISRNPASLHHKQGCCTAADAEDARLVAERLEVPFYALNLQADFDRIVDYFVAEYTTGRTPNPCVMCNNWIKFGRLFDYADSIRADFVATGHYARLVPGPADSASLRRGVDRQKDQSYVLFGIPSSLLTRMLLPVGDYQKPAIRERARRLGLRVAAKRDSQEICFVPAGRHTEFVTRRRPHDTSGDIVTTDGTSVGQHDGIEGFTVGQRKGLGVALGEPRYVVRIEPETYRVVIGTREELGRCTLRAGSANWLCATPSASFRCQVQIRYNGDAFPATVEPLSPEQFVVTFDAPCTGVAPGQAAVCYDGDQVLGGGWIE